MYHVQADISAATALSRFLANGFQPCKYSLGGVVWRGEQLECPYLACFGIVDDKVGESAAYIDANADLLDFWGWIYHLYTCQMNLRVTWKG